MTRVIVIVIVAKRIVRSIGATYIKGVINALSLGNSERRKLQNTAIKDNAERMPRVSCIDNSRCVSEGALCPHGTHYGYAIISTLAWVSVSVRL